MPILLIIVAILTLATCWQIYRITDSRATGTLINVLLIATAGIVSLSLLNISTGATIAQDGNGTTPNGDVPILDTSSVQRESSVSDTINATGSIVPNREVELAFQYSARVTEVLIEVGDRVEAGQVIARVNSNDIEQILQDAVFNTTNEQISFDELVGQPRDVDLAAAEAALQAAQLNFGGSTVLTGAGSTQAELQRLQLELANNRLWQVAIQRDETIKGIQSAGRELEATRNGDSGNDVDFGGLFTVTFPGPSEEDLEDQYNNALTQYYQALNSVNAAGAQRDLAAGQYQAELVRPPRYGGSPGASLQRTQAEQDLDRLLNGPDRDEIEFMQIDLALSNLALQQAELQLDYVELTAPFSGVITEVNMTVGEIPPGVAAVVMIDDSQFKVNLDIDEIDIMQVRVGQPVEFIVDALPDDNITGVVELVSLTPNQGSQVVSYNVRVVLDETEAPIRSGMSTTGQVVVSSLEGGLSVSPRFIYNDAITGSPYVIVQLDSGELQRIPIIIGEASGGDFVEVNGGIMQGQRVVLVSSEFVEQIPYRGNTNG